MSTEDLREYEGRRYVGVSPFNRVVCSSGEPALEL